MAQPHTPKDTRRHLAGESAVGRCVAPREGLHANKDACRPQPSRQDKCPRLRGSGPRRGGKAGRQGVALAWAGGGRGRRCGAAVWLHREGMTGVRARRLTQAAERHGRAGGSRAWTSPPTSGAGSRHKQAPKLGAGRRAVGACPRGWVGVG